MPILSLRAGDSELRLSPEQGGSVLSWSHKSTALLHAERGLGCFPLLPYANRIARGIFSHAGRTHQLKLNFGDHPHSIHGIGWQRAWTVSARTSSMARLSLTHNGGEGWPFPFEAAQDIALEPTILTITLHLTNRHDAPAPAGLGLHPFFPRSAGASLRFNARSVWLNDATALPIQETPVPPHWNHANGLPVGHDALDNCFNGWDGVAHLTPGLRLEASGAFRHLQVYTPAGQDFYCVEPVTHAPDAINRGDGMPILAPGETLSGIIILRMTETSSALAYL